MYITQCFKSPGTSFVKKKNTRCQYYDINKELKVNVIFIDYKYENR